MRLNKLAPAVPRDLDTIIHKAIAREPERRYATAAALADDLRRFVDGRSILARRASVAERAVRWCRRNPWVAGLSAAVFVSLVLGMGASTTLAVRAITAEAATRKQRDRAELEATRFKAVSEFLRKDMLAQASVGNQPTRESAPDPDLKVRTALDRAAANIGNRFAGQPLVEASIRQTIGETYYQLGLFSQARPHLERAIELRRSAQGDEDAETFSAMHSLGVLLDDDGKWTEAERYLVPAMEGLRKTRGADDLETLEAMANVGNLYSQLEKTKEAETLLSQALDGFRRTRGDQDVLTLRPDGQPRDGQPRPEENCASRAIGRGSRPKIAERRSGPITPIPWERGATWRRFMRRMASQREAEHLLNDVLQDMRRVLGDKHPDTLYTLAIIAEHYMNQRKMDEVEKYAADALEGSRTVLNDKHQVRAAALGFLASRVCSPSRLEETRAGVDRVGGTFTFPLGALTTTSLREGMGRRAAPHLPGRVFPG